MKDFAYELNILLDNGESLDLQETKERVKKGTVLDWLAKRYPNSKYDTLFEDINNGPRKQSIVHFLQNNDRKINIKNNGVCYLLAIMLN